MHAPGAECVQLHFRERKDASNKQLRQAAALLREAAGVRLDPSTVSPPANITDLLHQQAQASVLTRRVPGLEISDSGNVGALKELSVAYDMGEQYLPGLSCKCRACMPCIRT